MKFWVLFKKEFKETIRDKSVLISNFLFPLISLPLVFIFSAFASGLVALNGVDQSAYQILFTGDVSSKLIDKVKSVKRVKVSYIEKKLKDSDYQEYLKKNKLNLIVESNKVDNIIKYKLINDSSDTNKGSIYQKVKRLFASHADEVRAQKLKKLGLTDQQLNPVVIETRDFATLMSFAKKSVGGQIGIAMVVLLILGMYYPAINAFIGEKDKKTISILVFASQSERDIVLAKYLNIVLFGMLTFVPYLFDFIVIKFFLGDKIQQLGSFEFSSGVFLVFILNSFVLSFFIGSICVLISLLSKSMSRAQSFLGGMMFLLMVPAIILSVVNKQMTLTMALVPFMNFFYMIRDIVLSQVIVSHSYISMFINLSFTIVLVRVTLKVFKKQHVLKV
jgi:sodium transport system permease protein